MSAYTAPNYNAKIQHHGKLHAFRSRCGGDRPGSTATIAYGEPRFTNDIDIVLELHPEQICRFCGAFPESEYYLSRQAVESAVRSTSQFNLIHPASGLKVDFIVYSGTEFNQSRMARSRALPVLEDHSVQRFEFWQTDAGKMPVHDVHRAIDEHLADDSIFSTFPFRGRHRRQ